jgi:hypothetical protein
MSPAAAAAAAETDEEQAEWCVLLPLAFAHVQEVQEV